MLFLGRVSLRHRLKTGISRDCARRRRKLDTIRILYLPLVLKGTIMIQRLAALALLAATLLSQPSQRNDASAQSKPRARDLGIELDGAPGALNAITDVPGVEVGYATLVSGEGKLEVGKGPVRRSEERRVGKEGRYRWAPEDCTKGERCASA